MSTWSNLAIHAAYASSALLSTASSLDCSSRVGSPQQQSVELIFAMRSSFSSITCFSVELVSTCCACNRSRPICLVLCTQPWELYETHACLYGVITSQQLARNCWDREMKRQRREGNLNSRTSSYMHALRRRRRAITIATWRRNDRVSWKHSCH